VSQGLYLHWEGKRLYRQRVPTPRLLEPIPELSVGDDSANMIIEGDNLQVLASLKSHYGGQVDVVYIDPPYNLGKDDFRYSDKRFHDPDADDSDAVYVSNEDGGRHTKWLNFMAPRLFMLWDMLSNQGVIFVSINDVELFRIGMLLDEIFGEDNRVGILVWKGATDNNPTRIATEHEYVLCYAKTKNALPRQWTNQDDEVKTFILDGFDQIKAMYPAQQNEIVREFALFMKENKVYLGDLYRYRHTDEHGPFAARRNMDNPGKPGHDYEITHPVTKKPCKKPRWGWRFSPETMTELLEQNRVIFGKDETKIPELKVYLEDVNFPLRSVIALDSRAGSNDLFELFAERDIFKNPKPVNLIQTLLSYTAGKESLILDAFGGSGSTAQAVLALNSRDEGARRFILIEEGRGADGFCRTVTAERVKRAIEKYGYNDGFRFFATGQKLDGKAIVSLERDALASLICQADETGRGKGITRLTGYTYVIARNHRAEGICLVWNGNDDSEVTSEHLTVAAQEVDAAGLKRPFRIYGTFCRVGDTSSWKFCQIPDEILAQMHIQEDIGEEE